MAPGARFWLQLLFLWAFLLSMQSCRTSSPGGSGVGAKLIDCGAHEVFEAGIKYLGRVNSTLTDQMVDDSTTRAKLINLAIEAGENVIACLLRDQGGRYADAAAHNPADVESVIAERRAEAFIRERGIKFK